MPRHRSAKTGRAVTAEQAKANPDTTVRHGKSKDTKRLDWLQKKGADLYFSDDGTWRVQWPIGTEVNTVNDATPRRALDAAMKANA